jgi:hypothetical protein
MTRPKKSKRTQKTPRGYEIPLPTRGEIMKAFRKVTRPKKGG